MHVYLFNPRFDAAPTGPFLARVPVARHVATGTGGVFVRSFAGYGERGTSLVSTQHETGSLDSHECHECHECHDIGEEW